MAMCPRPSQCCVTECLAWPQPGCPTSMQRCESREHLVALNTSCSEAVPAALYSDTAVWRTEHVVGVGTGPEEHRMRGCIRAASHSQLLQGQPHPRTLCC